MLLNPTVLITSAWMKAEQQTLYDRNNSVKAGLSVVAHPARNNCQISLKPHTSKEEHIEQ